MLKVINMKKVITIVEDEKDLNELVKRYLEREGYEVRSYLTYDEASQHTNDDDVHLWILDIMLGDKSGFDLIEEIRQNDSQVPVIFMSARDKEFDRIIGLEKGSDDYITKPFSLRELEARIVTNIKREERHQQKTEYRFMDEMLIDYSEKIVAIAGHRMEFTKIEYQIIEFLSMHPGQVFDKERIYAQVCGYDAEGDSRTITELVRRIRKKIADYSEKEYIETVWGIGYRWKK